MSELEDLGAALEQSLEPAVEITPEVVPEVAEVVEETGEETEEIQEDGELFDESMDIKDFAEMAGIDVGDLYNSLTMKTAKGDTITLGEMKDQFQADGGSLQTQQAEFQQQQHRFAAEQSIQKEYGQPVTQIESAMQQLTDRYQQTNWKELIDAHGDKAELAKSRMQQEYSQLEVELSKRRGAYQQALNNFQYQITDENQSAILQMHPDWKDPDVARPALAEIHTAISDIVSLDEMTQIIAQMGPKALQIFERAKTGRQATNINKNRVRKAAKSFKGGKAGSAAQQLRNAKGKFVQAAKGGTRRQQQDAAIQLIAEHGI